MDGAGSGTLAKTGASIAGTGSADVAGRQALASLGRVPPMLVKSALCAAVVVGFYRVPLDAFLRLFVR